MVEALQRDGTDHYKHSPVELPTLPLVSDSVDS